MESTQNRLAYLQFYLELGAERTQKEEEKESWQEAFDRLWSQSNDLTEEEFGKRVDQLSAIAQQEIAADLAACTSCTDGSCELCSFLDSLFPAPQARPSAEYDERANEPISSLWGLEGCTCSGCRYSFSDAE